MAYSENSVFDKTINTEKTSGGWYASITFWQHPDVDANKSLIKWRAWVKNDTASVNSYTTGYGVKFYVDVVTPGLGNFVNGTYGNKEWWPDPSTPYKEYKVTSSPFSTPTTTETGSFYISHNDAGNAKVIITLAAWFIGSTDAYKKIGKETITFKSIVRYSNPGAPSNFAVTNSDYNLEGVFAPSSNRFEYSFTAGSDGLNNKIKYYQIRYSIGSTTNNIEVTNTSGDFELDSELLKNNRGQVLSFSICSVATQSGYSYSDYVSSSNYLRVNRLPNAPTGSNKTISSSAQTGHLDVTAGSDPDGQTTTVWYKTKSATNYSQYSTDQELKPGTYVFVTKDSIEEFSSNTKELTLFQNSKIKISNSKISYTLATSSLLDANEYEYIPRFSFSSITLSKPDALSKINVSIKYWDIGDTSGTGTLVDLGDFSTLQTLYAKSFYPGNIIGFGKIFEILLTPWDTIEEGFEMILRTNGSSSKKMAVAPQPKYKGFYNNHSNESKGEFPSIFWNKIRFIFTYDSVFYNANVTCGSLRISTEKSYGIIKDEKVMYFDATISDELVGGEEYTFSYSCFSSYYNAQVTDTIKMVEAKTISSLAILASRDTIKPFFDEDSNDFIIYFSKFYNDAGLSDYSFDTLSNTSDDANVKFSFIINNVNYSLNSKELISEEASNNLLAKFSNQSIYNELSALTQSGSYSARIKIDLTNTFGRIFTFSSNSLVTIDYNGPLTITFKENNVEKSDILKESLHEGETLTFKPTITGYTVGSISYQVQFSKDDKKTWVNYITGQANNKKVPTRGNPTEYNISSMKKVIGEISDINDCYFRIIATNNYSSVTSDPVGPFTRYKFITPQFQLLSATVDNSTLKVQYKVTDIGIDLSNTSYSIDTNNAKITLGYNLSSESATDDITTISERTDFSWDDFAKGTTITQEEIKQEADSYLCSLTCSIALSDIKDSSGKLIVKTTTQYIRYYILQPTVAYRKNKLGINTTSIDKTTDAVMVVRAPSESVRYIYFLGDSDSPSTAAEWSTIPCIDLKDHTIKNLLIDGGTWS